MKHPFDDPIETQTFGPLPGTFPLETSPRGIGDVNSNALGSGARYNSGKAALDLIPATILAAYYNEITDRYKQPRYRMTLECLGRFQMREVAPDGERGLLLHALNSLGDPVEVWSECARVFDYGRKKYAAWNWAKGMPWSVPIGCALRHIVLGPLAGKVTDNESSEPHRGHVACNLVMLLHYLTHYPAGDDRIVIPTEARK